MIMNDRQQKQYDKINKFLSQFGAKIKDGVDYVHSESKLSIVNKYGIERILRADSVKRLSKKLDYWTFDGTMCDRQKEAYQKLVVIAKNNNGRVISNKYVYFEEKMEFEDQDCNRFFKTPADIFGNSWSPFETKRVYNNPEHHLNELRAIALKRGGKLISTEYKNSSDKLEFEDKDFNRFYMSSTDIKRQHWSPFESKRVFNNPEHHLNELRAIALKRGGKLISTEYKGSHSKLEFEDASFNRFFTQATDIKMGKWSPYEAKQVKEPQYHLNELKQIAESKGGKLISTEYKASREKLEFEDRNGARFFISSNCVKRGQWSPYEIFNLSEEICRQCIEYIFNKKFMSTWDIIKRSGKNNFQLDGYNKELHMAFEYQGEQHYEENIKTGGSVIVSLEDFEKRKKNDIEKKKWCDKNKLTLFIIKYFESCKSDKDHLLHVIGELKKINNKKINLILSNVKLDNFKIDYKALPTKQKYLDELKIIANSKGGKLISTQYINNTKKLEFEDAAGNRFFTSPANIKCDRWSPYESGKVKDPKYHFNILKNIAKEKGGKLISDKYIDSRTTLEFENSTGVRFFMLPYKVKQGQWKDSKK